MKTESPRTAYDVYSALPEAKIELIKCKIVLGEVIDTKAHAPRGSGCSR